MIHFRFRSTLAVALSAALVALSPGWGAYEAAARTLGVSATNAGSAPVAAPGAIQGFRGTGASLSLSDIGSVTIEGSLPTLAPIAGFSPTADTVETVSRGVSSSKAAPVPSAAKPVSFVKTAPAASVSLAAPKGARALPGTKASVTSRAPPAAPGKASLLASLSLAIPNFSKMGTAGAKASAHADFQARLGRRMTRGAPVGVNAADASSRKRMRLQAARASSEDMPDHDGGAADRDNPDGIDDLDDLGNPRRRGGEGGPDDATDPDYGGDRGGSGDYVGGFPLFASAAPVFLAASAMFMGGAFVDGAFAAKLMFVPLYLGLMIPAFILHEMGHAWVAKKLGDPGPALKGRLSFKPKNLLTHIDPIWTIAVPLGLFLTTGILFGGARPIETNADRFARPDRDSALVALAGPAVNFGLAALGGIAFAAAAALGAPAIVGSLAAAFVFFNVLLGMFNMIPVAPLDGHHVTRWFLSDVLGRPDWGAKAAAVPHIQYMLLIGAFLGVNFLFPGAIIGALQAVTSWFLGVPLMALGAAGATVAAAGAGAGMMAGTVKSRDSDKSLPPNSLEAATPIASDREETPPAKTYIVQFEGAQTPIATDAHLGSVDVNASGGMGLFRQTAQTMTAELSRMGLTLGALGHFNASPVATYRRINAATIQIAETRSSDFKAAMEARGYRVFENEERNIVIPIEDDPSITIPESDKSMWGKTTIDETKKLSTMDKLHEVARKRWGSPHLGGFRGKLLAAILGLLRVTVPQPLIGVIDTGIEPTHKSIAPGLKAAKDVRPDGDGVDVNGHGTWTHGMVNIYAPWLKKSMTHYKAFSNRGATLDDILKALTMSANDGNLVVSNSWGSNAGDPDSPDSQLVKKIAEEGRIMVFAAGNNGYSGKNTIGSPAITVHTAPNGAPRVIAVAATDSNKKVTRFSSKGPGSRVTKRGGKWENHPRRPDMAEQGNDTEGPWPSFKSPSRTDATYGPVRAISGTSMSTPKVAGTIAMLAQLFGVTKVGEELDKIAWAVMEALDKNTGGQDWEIGDGFSVAYDAYQKLASVGMRPMRPNWLVRLAIWLLDSRPVRAGPPNPGPETPSGSK
jgi:Zn-dependent protease